MHNFRKRKQKINCTSKVAITVRSVVAYTRHDNPTNP